MNKKNLISYLEKLKNINVHNLGVAYHINVLINRIRYYPEDSNIKYFYRETVYCASNMNDSLFSDKDKEYYKNRLEIDKFVFGNLYKSLKL